MDEVDRKSLQGLWQRMKEKEKVVHDRALLNLFRQTRTTGGGVGPSPLHLDDPDEFDEEPGMESQSELSGMTLSQNSPMLTPWNNTARVRNLPHTVTSSTVPTDQIVEVIVPVNSGDNILVEAMALNDVGVGQQEMAGDDSNQSLPDPEANTGAPTIDIVDNDPNPAVVPTPTITERPVRAPKRPNAAAKANAYVAVADHTKSYWTEKLKMDKEIYNAYMGLLAGQMELNSMQIELNSRQIQYQDMLIENQKKSDELLQLQLKKALKDLDHQ